MYCRNCGNEILGTDKFCWKCGEKISKALAYNNKEEIESINVPNMSSTNQSNTNINANLPMRWWNFWKYVRFPLGLIFSLFRLSTYKYTSFNFYVLAFVITDIIMLLFAIYTYDLFMHKKKKGYLIFILFMFVESIYSCGFSTLNTALSNTTILESWEFILSFILVLIIWGIIWILPNYIYFKKRKECFCND